MAQFLEIKAANPDCLLWYRMGDFYELFFDDAVAASAALGIVLTKRGKHLGQDIPMCGVPIHRADEYLQRLIRPGIASPSAEQLEDPAEARKRGSKAVVRRDVVRLVTPGTLTEDTLLDAKARNYLTALFRAGGEARAACCNRPMLALASLDISTGEFEVGEVAGADLPGELARLVAGRGDRARRACWPMRTCAHGSSAPAPRRRRCPAPTSTAWPASEPQEAAEGVAELGGFGSFTRAGAGGHRRGCSSTSS